MSHPPVIGVFDSGVGGLSVLRHIRAALPQANLIYAADSAHVPYGDKPADYIIERSQRLSEFLLGQGADALVIACNTATAVAAAPLRAQYAQPIIAMEPAVKPAVAATRNRHIGVLATVGTLESARFAALLDRHAGNADIHTRGCSGWVEQVERGELDSPTTRALVQHHLAPLLERDVDTLVLGCTHYPFLAPVIADLAGPNIQLIDTGAAVARQLCRRLALEPAPADNVPSGSTRFFTSGGRDQGDTALAALWPEPARFSDLPVPWR